MSATKTKEQFISEMYVKFPEADYDYSETEYVNNNTKVVITCRKHTCTFSKTPNSMLSTKKACPECIKEKRKTAGRSMTKQQFLEKATDKFGNRFDYSKMMYTAKSNPVSIVCLTHGELQIC